MARFGKSDNARQRNEDQHFSKGKDSKGREIDRGYKDDDDDQRWGQDHRDHDGHGRGRDDHRDHDRHGRGRDDYRDHDRHRDHDDHGHGRGDHHHQGGGDHGHGHGGPYGGPVNGGDGDDVIDQSGAAQGVRINGGDGDDDIIGSGFDDRVNAGDGDDRVQGGAGDDTMFGNCGDDTAVFSGSILDYQIIFNKRGKTTEVIGLDGHDTLKHFEHLEFGDYTYHIGSNNDPFVVLSDATVPENGVQSLSVQVFDFDGDTPTVLSATLSDTDGQPGTGTLTIGASTPVTSAGGWSGSEVTLSFDPGTAFDYLAVGESVVETIMLVVDDGQGGTRTVNSSLTIEGLNDGVQVTSGVQSGGVAELADGALGEGTAMLTAIGSIVFADVDLSDTHTATATPDGAGYLGALTVSVNEAAGVANGNVDWTFAVSDGVLEGLAQGEELVQTYTVIIDDGNGATATDTVTVTITGANDAPTLADGTAEAFEGSGAVDVDLSALADDIDSDDTPGSLAYAIITPPAGGSVSLSGTTLSFDPGSDFDALANGEEAEVDIVVQVMDSHGATATSTVTITVIGTNAAPVAVDDSTITDENTAVFIPVLGNDFDSDVGDVLSVTAVSVTAGGGSATVTGSGVTWDPGTDYDALAVGEVATVVLSYTIEDQASETASATVTLTVTGTNDGPLAVADMASANEDGSASVIEVLSNDSDPDGDSLAVLSVDDTGTVGAATLTSAGDVEYDPNGAFEALGAGASAVDTFVYTITDGAGLTDSATVSVVVQGENDGPVAVDDLRTISESASINIQVLDNDTDIDVGDTLSVLGAVKLTSEGGGTFDATQVTFETQGDFEYLGVGESTDVVINYTIADSQGATDSAQITVTVTGENDGPVAVADNATVSEDASGTFVDLLGNDSDVDLSDVLSVLSLDTTGTSGTVVLTGSGVTYTPGAALNALAVGESVVDTFSYTITDGNGGEDEATVSITVTGANDAPDAVDDAFTGGPAGLGGNVLADNGAGADSDPDTSDTLEVIAVNGLASQVGQALIILSGQTVRLDGDGTFVLNGNGQFDGLGAGESFAGTILTYTVSDGHGGTDSASISIEVFGENDAPLAIDDAFATGESQAFVAGVFRLGDPDADSDPDGDAFSIVALNGATGTTQMLASGAVVTLVSAATGQISYDTNGAFEGLLDGETVEDTFTYSISDGAGVTDTATVMVTVFGENDAPVAADDSSAGDPVIEAGVSEPGDDTATGNVLANDSDVDAIGPLVVTFVQSDTGAPGSAMPVVSGVTQVILGRYGALLMDSDGTWTYDLNDLDPDTEALDAGDVGVETFTYTVSDGLGGTDTAVLTVDIQGSSDETAPNAVDDAISLVEDGSASFDPRANDSDDQGDPITLVGVGAASHGTVAIDDKGTATTTDDEVVYTPDADFAGTDSFTYTISDGQFTATASVSVEVEAVADTPTVNLGVPPIANDLTPSAWPGFGDKTADIGFTGLQWSADVTALNDGGFMLTWYTTQTNSNATPVYLYTQEYNAEGVAETPFTLIPPQHVYPTYGPFQLGHDTVQLPNGTKVWGWAENSSASTDGVHIRMETSGGSVFTQTLYTSGSLPASSVEIAVLDDGGFAVAFAAPTAPSGWALYSQRFDSAGVAQTVPTPIYSTAGIITSQHIDAVDGGYVVSFSTPGTSGYATYAIVRETAPGADTTVGFATVAGASVASSPSSDVAGLADGTFVVTWQDFGTSGTLDIFAARFDTSGAQIGATQVVNTSTVNREERPTVIALDDGGFMVSWTSFISGTSTSNGIYGQRFDASGAKVGLEVRIDTIANGNEYGFAGDGMAQLSDGSLITTWGATFGAASDIQFTRTEMTEPVNGYEDTPLAIDVSAALTDLDGSETLTLILDGFPSGAAFNIGAAGPGDTWVIANAEGLDLSTLLMTPPANWNGTFTLTATATSQEATNGDTASATATETFTIAAVNDDPEPGVVSATTLEDTPTTLDVLGAATDVDGDTVTIVEFTQGMHGTIELDDQGDADPTNDRLVYTPDPDFFGTDSFTYTLADGQGGVVLQTVDVTVGAENDLPVANDISGSTSEGSHVTVGSAWPPITGPVTTDLTSYFMLEDGVGFFIGGARTPGTTGTAAEIHQTFGSFSDGYIVLFDSGVGTGGASQFSAQAFTLVGGVMTAVDATHWSASGYAGTVDTSGTVFTGTGADANFDIRFEILDLPATNDRTVSYQLDARRLDLGTGAPDDFVTRAVIEGERVTALPQAPILLTANVSDVEDAIGDLTFIVDDSATQGSVVNNGDGTFDYSPLASFNDLGDGETAIDTFEYTVVDSSGATASATATIQITGRDPSFTDPFFEPAEAPVLVDDTFGLTNTVGAQTFDVLANDSDANNDPLTLVGVTQPSTGTVSISGNQLLFDPGAPFDGLDLGQTAQVSVEYTVTDGVFTETATATFNVTGGVAFDPRTQTATDTGTGLVGQALSLQLTAPERTNDGTADATIDVSIGDPVDGLIDVVFVVDRSGSTEFSGSNLIAGVGDQNGDLVPDTVLDAEILAVSNLVDAIVAQGFADGTVTLTLVPFSSIPSTAITVTLDTSDDVSGGLSDADVFKQALSALNGSGGTNYIPALEAAGATFEQLELDNGAATSSKYLYFVTDGDPADRLPDTEPDPFAPIQAVTDQLTAEGVTMAAVGINANPSALRQEALDAVDNTGGGIFTTNFVDLDAALLAGAQPDATLIDADVFVFNSSGVQVGTQSFTDASFSASPFGLTLELPGLSGLDSLYGDINELLVQANFDTDDDGLSDLTLDASLQIAGALPDAVLL